MITRVFIFILTCIAFYSANNCYAQDSISVSPVSFNTDGREYAPAYHKGSLVFCGDNLNNEGLTYVDKETNKQLTDIYSINIDSSNHPQLFSKELKTSFHDGPITFSADGNTAYFTRSQRTKRELRNSIEIYNTLGVYKATFDGVKWINIEPCSFNSPDFNVGHPYLSKDGKRLYVTSDKPGGYGGLDIYVANIINGNCDSLVNIGKQINSINNEMFPYINGGNRLYFSSDREGGQGGLDIYFSNLLNKKWTASIAVDTTFNSSFDDFGIIYNDSESEGYFCSNRLGSDDIFKFNVVYPPFNDCQELINEILCYEFYEEATLNADSVAMIYEWDFGDGHKERSLETYHCYEKSGMYIVELNIMDPMIDKNFVNEATYELEIESVNQPLIIAADTVSINQSYSVKVRQGKWEDFQITNYYVDYGDSSKIVKNPIIGHRYLKAELLTLKVLISGFSETSNTIETKCFYKNIFVKDGPTILLDSLQLVNSSLALDSAYLADSLWLAKEKIFMEELEYANFSAEKIEEFEDSYFALEIMNSEKSIINDSVMLKIYYNKVKEIYNDKTGIYSYVLGRSSDPFVFIDEFRLAHKNGFSHAMVKAFEKLEITIADLGMIYDNDSGEVKIILNNIQFEYDGYELDADSKKELNKMIDFLKKNNEETIEVGAYTDASRNVEKAKKLFKNKGLVYTKEAHDKMSSNYNLNLSKKRANSVVQYLISKGIAKNQLIAKGYGESFPLAPNQNEDGTDNKEGRAKNRRVEFKVIE